MEKETNYKVQRDLQLKIQSKLYGNIQINIVYVKTQSNVQKIRNYLTTFRNDIDYSSQFEIMEDKFIKVTKGCDNITYYQLDKKEKILLDNFMLARSKGLLLNRSNIDPRTGKPNIVDPKKSSNYWGLAA